MVDGNITDALLQPAGKNVFDIDGSVDATINGGDGNDSLPLMGHTGGSYSFGAGDDTVNADGAATDQQTFTREEMTWLSSPFVTSSTIYLAAGNDTVTAGDLVSGSPSLLSLVTTVLLLSRLTPSR